MEDLRIHSTDGDHLVLESQDGSRHRLLIDDSLRTAIRSAATIATTQISLTPREIQAAIRSGSSVEDLLTKSGDPREYLEKFAQPVLDELTHILASALGVRISVAGDRYNDVSQTEFGEIISSRLNASGAHDHRWSTFRDENHSWNIVVEYLLNGSGNKAVWFFDPKKLLLSPENENAIALSTQNQLTAPPKLKPVEIAEVAATTDTASLPDTQRFETVIPIGRANDRAQIEKPASEQKIAESKDLLDALKKKREERAAETAAIQVVELDNPGLPVDEIDSAEEPAPAPVRRSGRPSIPSFDEIVQGTKSEDE
jgi:hypothetical protein